MLLFEHFQKAFRLLACYMLVFEVILEFLSRSNCSKHAGGFIHLLLQEGVCYSCIYLKILDVLHFFWETSASYHGESHAD